jgi:hypothetical protein
MEAVPLNNIFADKHGILVKQTMKGCLQECFGCTAESEYHISDMDYAFLQDTRLLKEGAMTQPNVMYAHEKSSCCLRWCCKDARPMTLHLTAGDGEGGPKVIEYQKPWTCPSWCVVDLSLCVDLIVDTGGSCVLACPCCCCLPRVHSVGSADGKEVARAEYVYSCDCVPKFKYSEGGKQVFDVRPDTCCNGCCPKGRASRIPFYFFEPGTDTRVADGQISKVWAGLKKECCSTADNYAVFFHKGCDAERKAGLLGMTFLMDFTLFEGVR